MVQVDTSGHKARFLGISVSIIIEENQGVPPRPLGKRNWKSSGTNVDMNEPMPQKLGVGEKVFIFLYLLLLLLCCVLYVCGGCVM